MLNILVVFINTVYYILQKLILDIIQGLFLKYQTLSFFSETMWTRFIRLGSFIFKINLIVCNFACLLIFNIFSHASRYTCSRYTVGVYLNTCKHRIFSFLLLLNILSSDTES